MASARPPHWYASRRSRRSDNMIPHDADQRGQMKRECRRAYPGGAQLAEAVGHERAETSARHDHHRRQSEEERATLDDVDQTDELEAVLREQDETDDEGGC